MLVRKRRDWLGEKCHRQQTGEERDDEETAHQSTLEGSTAWHVRVWQAQKVVPTSAGLNMSVSNNESRSIEVCFPEFARRGGIEPAATATLPSMHVPEEQSPLPLLALPASTLLDSAKVTILFLCGSRCAVVGEGLVGEETVVELEPLWSAPSFVFAFPLPLTLIAWLSSERGDTTASGSVVVSSTERSVAAPTASSSEDLLYETGERIASEEGKRLCQSQSQRTAKVGESSGMATSH